MERAEILALSESELPPAPQLGNDLLGALPASDLRRVLPLLRQTSVAPGASLFKAASPARNVFFPVDCIVALTSGSDRGIEVALVGAEGLLIPGPVGASRAAFSAVAHVPGRILVADAGALYALCDGSSTLRRLLDHWQTGLMLQVQSVAACNALHDVERRLCRWLLQFHERVSGNMLPVTQEMLANMLGVQRTTVTLVVHRLKTRGILRQRRGRIEILDLAALDRSACDCHRLLKKAQQAVLSPELERMSED